MLSRGAAGGFVRRSPNPFGVESFSSDEGSSPGPRGCLMGTPLGFGVGGLGLTESLEVERGGVIVSRPLPSSPKIRSRAAWYLASLSLSVSADAAVGGGVEDWELELVGLFKIRMVGWNTPAAGERIARVELAEGESMTDGMGLGAFALLVEELH